MFKEQAAEKMLPEAQSVGRTVGRREMGEREREREREVGLAERKETCSRARGLIVIPRAFRLLLLTVSGRVQASRY